MRLTLSTLRCPDTVVPETRSIGGGEFSLGRAPDNSWVLADPDRHLSKRHCVLAFRNGGWQIADLSTNGTFLNRDGAPIGQGEVRDLRDGDRIRVGAYEIEVRIEEEGAFAPAPPSASAMRGGANPFDDDPFAAPPLSAPGLPSSPAVTAWRDEGPMLPADFDPLAPAERDPFTGPSIADHSPATSDAFRPPSAAPAPPAPGLLPDDWDLDEPLIPPTQPAAPPPQQVFAPPPPAAYAPPEPAAFAPPPQPVHAPPPAPPAYAPPEASPFAPTPQPVQAPPPAPPTHAPPEASPFAPPPAPPAYAPPEASPFAPPQPVHAPPPAPPAYAPPPEPVHAPPPQAFAPPPSRDTPFREPTTSGTPSPFGAPEPPEERPVSPPPAPVVPPVMAAAPAAPHPVPAAPMADGAALAAFLRGAGMPNARIEDPMATMEALGATFRAVVHGLRAVLIARASIKGEFRIEQTMIRARGNNPLKFSADDDDALSAMLGTGRRTNMGPAESVAEALRDMTMHELATITAMQHAVREVLKWLAPEEAMAAAAGGLLPMQKKANAFDAYADTHQALVAALTDDFESVFGKAFARAYEQALREVAAKPEER